MTDSLRNESRTGICIMLFSDTGNAEAAVDWQDAADRIVAYLDSRMGTGNDAWAQARAHRILQAIFAEAFAEADE